MEGGSQQGTILSTYRPPCLTNNPVTLAIFLNEFPNWAANKLPEDTNICIVGDFNMHINDGQDTKANIFCGMMEAMGLQQHINFATCKLGNILDLVFT